MAVEPRESAPGKRKARAEPASHHRSMLGRFPALALPQDGHAQTYPDRTISYIVPSSPGSSPDIVGRIMAEALARILGQPVVVLNRAGAGDDRRCRRRKGGAGRLYDPSGQHQPLLQPDALQESQLRPRERLRSGRTLCIGLLHRPGASQGRRQNPERADRQGQGAAWKTELRVGRSGGCDVHRRRSAESAGADRHGSCALQRRRTRARLDPVGRDRHLRFALYHRQTLRR